MIKCTLPIISLLFLIILFFLACNDSGCAVEGGVFTVNSVEEFDRLLKKLPDNTAEKPYTILLNADDLTGVSKTIRKNHYSNNGLKTVYINLDLSGSNITNIEDNTFSYCFNLIKITIPNSVIVIGRYAFFSCENLASIIIGNNVTAIGDSAFLACTSLTNITIPDSVNSIGDRVFDQCFNLSVIDVTANNTAYSSNDGILFNKDKTTLIKCPEKKAGTVVIPNTVIVIGDDAFFGCGSLTGGVTIPDSVTGIGDWAFYYCYSLTGVTIGNGVTVIGKSAFDNCRSLTSVTIGNSVTVIGETAFYSCIDITDVTVPDRITGIGDFAFSNCKSLTNVTFESAISPGNFSFSSFPGDLREKFYAEDAVNGTPGTYTRENGESTTWTRQL